jgi:diguanylate cyclase (GGDEF)-like protein/hemerythrin-like metal-binding protein
VSNPLLGQLDYIYFFYGLVLFLLGSVCLSMSRGGSLPTPWWLLGAFALAHGAAEWLHLLALAGGDSATFRLVRDLIITASFLLLLEFARRTHRVVRGRTAGPWIHLVALAAVLVLGLAFGTRHLASAVRPTIAAPAIFWTAGLFLFASARTEELGGGPNAYRARLLAGIYFALFGVSAGLVMPRAPFIPAFWPTEEGVLAQLGMPVQLIRGVTVCVMAVSVWALAISFDPKGKVLRKRRLLFWVMASSIFVLLTGGWLFTDRLGRIHQQDVIDEAGASAAMVYDHLAMEMEATERGARTLAGLLGRRLADGTPLSQAGRDDLVDAIAADSREWIAYLLDPAGTTIATSNRATPKSFIGANYGGRPYFQAALAGRPGRFMGMGLVSGAPGYFASEPVTGRDGRLLLVAVVKRTLGPEQLGPTGLDGSYLVSTEGMVLVAAGRLLPGQMLWNDPGRATAGGALVPGAPPPLLDHAVAGTEWIAAAGGRQVAVRRAIPETDWSLVVLKAEKTQVANRLLGIVITLLLCSVVLTYFVAMQRQLGAESQVNDRRRAAEGRARDSERRADTDALTGVFNRLGIDGLFAVELERARRYGHPFSVVMFDLDHFKRVNDQHGHAAGDQVLVGAARIVETNIRDSDAVGRWGGEEFVVLAPATAAGGGIRLAEKLRAVMERTVYGPVGSVTGSFGVAEFRPGDTVESLLKRADAALYRAKGTGRNRVACDDADVAATLAAGAPEAAAGQAPMLASVVPLLHGSAIYEETGFTPIDLEHRALSEAIEAFFAMLSTGRSEEVQMALETIIAGVGAHFGHEERLMEAHGFPDRVRHARQHLLFGSEAREFLEELTRSGVTIPFRRWAVGRLPEWFRFHIVEYDVDLARFLLRAGARDGDTPPRRGVGLSQAVQHG